MSSQERVNELANLLKAQAIELLIKEDCLRYNADMPSQDKMLYMVQEIYRLPVCTKKLRDLFAAAHEMHEEKGMFPHTVCVGDLELVARNYDDFTGTGEKYPWLPRKNDERMKTLPAFVELDSIYKAAKTAIAPVDIESVENEAINIVNEISTNLTRGF